MNCNIKDMIVDDGFCNRIRTTPKGILPKIKLWLCTRKGSHDLEIILDDWYDGNITYDDWPKGTRISEAPKVALKDSRRWCSRHTILRCSKCGFEWERLSSGVKGCGAHTWIAGRQFPIEWQCLPWGDPDLTVKTGTSSIPSSVLQVYDSKLYKLIADLKV